MEEEARVLRWVQMYKPGGQKRVEVKGVGSVKKGIRKKKGGSRRELGKKKGGESCR